LFVGGWALSQLWLFWVAPLVGAGIAGLAYQGLASEEPAPQQEQEPLKARAAVQS